MWIVEVDGLQIAYERYGDGPPLVLLHGYVGDGLTTWRQPSSAGRCSGPTSWPAWCSCKRPSSAPASPASPAGTWPPSRGPCTTRSRGPPRPRPPSRCSLTNKQPPKSTYSPNATATPTLAANGYMLDEDWGVNFIPGLNYQVDGLETHTSTS